MSRMRSQTHSARTRRAGPTAWSEHCWSPAAAAAPAAARAWLVSLPARGICVVRFQIAEGAARCRPVMMLSLLLPMPPFVPPRSLELLFEFFRYM